MPLLIEHRAISFEDWSWMITKLYCIVATRQLRDEKGSVVLQARFSKFGRGVSIKVAEDSKGKVTQGVIGGWYQVGPSVATCLGRRYNVEHQEVREVVCMQFL